LLQGGADPVRTVYPRLQFFDDPYLPPLFHSKLPPYKGRAKTVLTATTLQNHGSAQVLSFIRIRSLFIQFVPYLLLTTLLISAISSDLHLRRSGRERFSWGFFVVFFSSEGHFV